MSNLQSRDRLKDAYFVNLNTIKDPTLLNTQVLNWIKIYDEYEIHFDLIVIESLKNLITGKRFFHEERIRKDFNNRMMRIYLAKTGSFISTFLVLVFLLYYLRKQLIQKRTIVLQTRSELYFKPLSILKKWIGSRFRIVYDSRGSSPEEFRYAFLKDSESIWIRNKVTAMRGLEKDMVVLADRVFCVSHALKKYHMQNNPGIPESKFFVSPCNADPSLFFFDPVLRYKMRDELVINEKKVLVYSGGLKMPWHIPDGVFELFSKICDTKNNLLLLVLTSEDEMAREFKIKYNIPDEKIKIYNINNKEVCAYLNAADLAILLRHDMPVNNVASPTKFAEYLMTGLPVLISPNVGDFTEFVEEHNVGFVLPTPYTDGDLMKLKTYLLVPTRSKEEIAELGTAHFSKKANIEPKIEQYIQLTMYN